MGEVFVLLVDPSEPGGQFDLGVRPAPPGGVLLRDGFITPTAILPHTTNGHAA